MKFKLLSVALLYLLLIMPIKVDAHPGRTDANGCHYCRTNCTKWGLSTGEYHCHNGSGSNSSSSSSYNSTNSYNSNTSSNATGSYSQTILQPEPPKSNDNTLKSVTVDGTTIAVTDQMRYETNKGKVTILVETNDAKAISTVNNKYLTVGENNISIIVTAEDGSKKNYILIIKRLSNNTNIKIKVGEEYVNFVDDKANIIVSSDTIKLNYEYELEDKNAKVEIIDDKELKYGDNIVKFKVIAEDGTERVYKLIVDKSTKAEEIADGMVSIGVIGGIGYVIYYVTKKKKNNKT